MRQVSVKFMMTARVYNIMKYMRYLDKGLRTKYWVAHEVTRPEKFKKLSAKRLNNRIARHRRKVLNGVAKNYKYKSTRR